jgi:hypothetical protein
MKRLMLPIPTTVALASAGFFQFKNRGITTKMKYQTVNKNATSVAGNVFPTRCKKKIILR